jgi:hypothetical protein
MLLGNILEGALCFLKVWSTKAPKEVRSAKRLNRSVVTRARPRPAADRVPRLDEDGVHRAGHRAGHVLGIREVGHRAVEGVGPARVRGVRSSWNGAAVRGARTSQSHARERSAAVVGPDVGRLMGCEIVQGVP